MKTWVKLYTEIIEDPKIGSLTWAQQGVWAALLALAGRLDRRDENDVETGCLDTLENTAWHLRCPQDEFLSALEAFQDRGMIDERDGLLFLNRYAEQQKWPRRRDQTAEWQNLRIRILERDNWTCQYCGEPAEHVDHIIPHSIGGKDTERNLVAACAKCNMHKGARTPAEAKMTLRSQHAVGQN